jgi:hypothetical protein
MHNGSGVKEGKRPLGRPRQRWEGSIKMNLREIVGGCRLDSFGLGWGPMAGFCEDRNESSVLSGVAEHLLASQEGLDSVKLVNI